MRQGLCLMWWVGGVPRFLGDVVIGEELFEFGASAGAAVTGEADGVDHAVIGQGGSGRAVQGCCGGEGVGDDLRGDSGVSGDVEGVARVVVQPGDDFAVLPWGAVCLGEAVVGEIGLPRLVGLCCLEADVGGAWPFPGLGDDSACSGEYAVDRGARDVRVVVVFQMPADRVGADVEPFPAQFST